MVVNNPPNIASGRNSSLVGATPFYWQPSMRRRPDAPACREGRPTIPTVTGVTPFMAAAGIGLARQPGPNNGCPADTLEAVKLA
jgi:hypothetical protein